MDQTIRPVAQPEARLSMRLVRAANTTSRPSAGRERPQQFGQILGPILAVAVHHHHGFGVGELVKVIQPERNRPLVALVRAQVKDLHRIQRQRNFVPASPRGIGSVEASSTIRTDTAAQACFQTSNRPVDLRGSSRRSDSQSLKLGIRIAR